MKAPFTRLAISLLFLGLRPALPVLADDLDNSVAQALKTVKNGAADLKKRSSEQAPQEALPVRLRFDKNVPIDIRKQVYDDLTFVNTIQGSGATKLHELVFGRVDGPTYIRWFASRIKSFGLDDKDPDPNAYAYVLLMDEPKMWLYPAYSSPDLSQMGRIDTLFHEARHAERNNGGWDHVDCPKPFKNEDGRDILNVEGVPFAGRTGACDNTSLGAYGIAAIMLKNIQRFCVNCTEKVRMDAGFYGDDDLNRITGRRARQAIKTDLH